MSNEQKKYFRYQVVVNGARTEDNLFKGPAAAISKANQLIKRGGGNWWIKIEDRVTKNILAESKDGSKIRKLRYTL
jgi:hypothetical protein